MGPPTDFHKDTNEMFRAMTVTPSVLNVRARGSRKKIGGVVFDGRPRLYAGTMKSFRFKEGRKSRIVRFGVPNAAQLASPILKIETLRGAPWAGSYADVRAPGAGNSKMELMMHRGIWPSLQEINLQLFAHQRVRDPEAVSVAMLTRYGVSEEAARRHYRLSQSIIEPRSGELEQLIEQAKKFSKDSSVFGASLIVDEDEIMGMDQSALTKFVKEHELDIRVSGRKLADVREEVIHQLFDGDDDVVLEDDLDEDEDDDDADFEDEEDDNEDDDDGDEDDES